jgi:hypothetical protein
LRIGLDFDHVLFDTEKFKKHLFDEIEGFDESYGEARDDRGVYSPSKHAELLGVSPAKLMDAVGYASRCLYPDVQDLERIEHELWIVSRGEKTFQAEKIRKSGVLEHVDGFTVVVDERKDEDTGIEALVDDREEELERTELEADRKLRIERPCEGVKEIVRWARELS